MQLTRHKTTAKHNWHVICNCNQTLQCDADNCNWLHTVNNHRVRFKVHLIISQLPVASVKLNCYRSAKHAHRLTTTNS